MAEQRRPMFLMGASSFSASNEFLDADYRVSLSALLGSGLAEVDFEFQFILDWCAVWAEFRNLGLEFPGRLH